MGAVIGTQTSDVSTVCKSEWNRYKEDIGKCKPEWDVILDDFRRIHVNTTASEFLSHSYDMIENLFLGCKEVVSREVHDQFVETITKRIEEITQYDWEHRREKEPFNQVIKLFRSTEDMSKDRKTEMLFVMAIKITAVSANYESCLKLQLRSHKIIPPEAAPTGARCCQDQSVLSTLEHAQEQLFLLDPT